jgi:hypothetical protein
MDPRFELVHPKRKDTFATSLAESKEKVRSALNRAIHKSGRNVATASDAVFLYVWNQGK